MAENNKKVLAPKIDARVLWQMSDTDFNEWRAKYDYPRIISFLKNKSPHFDDWMKDQLLTDEILIKFFPSSFLKNQKKIYIINYTYKENNENNEILVDDLSFINDSHLQQNIIKKKISIIPYPYWYLKKYNENAPDFSINLRQGRSHFLLSELELLDLGNIHLANMWILGKRHLDFINLCDLKISNCLINSTFNLWFCSATNISIEGDLAFLNAYNTKFYEVFNHKFNNLKLQNGRFQSWSFTNCELDFSATNSVLHLWEFNGWDFTATISNTDIRECNFVNSKILYPISLGRAKDFHSKIKRLYSQIGKKKEASSHYYLEKTFERKTFLHIKENYRNESFKAKGNFAKKRLKIKFYLKYIYSGFQNILWGYGEKPSRIFNISILTIIIFTLLYCYSPEASIYTRNNFLNSLYYSIVTFTTLGYGDISQTNVYLRLLSSFEALLGMSFWGILIAGFTSNSKDY